MLVVRGDRPDADRRDVLLGAVTHALLHRSHCPVLVVPTR
ncbi:universal stress protein [Streptomyces sp. NPDC001668]